MVVHWSTQTPLVDWQCPLSSDSRTDESDTLQTRNPESRVSTTTSFAFFLSDGRWSKAEMVVEGEEMGWRDGVETGEWSGVESGEWRVESGVEGRTRCVVMESGRREKREKREGKEEGVIFLGGFASDP